MQRVFSARAEHIAAAINVPLVTTATLTDVEQVAGMLPIQRCDDLAGEESLEGDNVHLGLAEGLFDRLAPLHDAARGPVTSAPAMRTLGAK